MKTTRLTLTALWMALFLGGLPPHVHATTVLALSLEKLVARADLIVVGSVMRTESRWAKPGQLIVTDAEIEVTQAVKGDATSGSTLVVTQLGGEMGRVALTIPGTPRLRPGQQALLFLQHSKSANELRVVGMSQGVLQVVSNDGVPTILPPIDSEGLVTRNADGKFARGTAAISQAVALSSLLERINALLK